MCDVARWWWIFQALLAVCWEVFDVRNIGRCLEGGCEVGHGFGIFNVQWQGECIYDWGHCRLLPL